MDKKEFSAEERLEQLNEERNKLKVQVSIERADRIEADKKMRAERDKKIENLKEILKAISAIIYKYNKLGKVAKMKVDVLKMITEEINCPEAEPKPEESEN